MTEALDSTSPGTKPRPTAEPDLDRAVTQMLQRQVEPSADADADLLAIERRFVELDDAASALGEEIDVTEDALPVVEMPAALQVQRHDWIYVSIPRPSIIQDGDGHGRYAPYGRGEVEFLRANPCVTVTVGGTEGELQEDGSRHRTDGPAQERADTIVAAWDRWQAEIAAAKEAAGLPEMRARHRSLVDARDTVLQRMREMSARTLAGLAAKARVAVSMGVIDEGLKAYGLRHRDAVHPDAFLYDVAGDVLTLAGDTVPPAEDDKPATAAETASLEFEGYSLDEPLLSPTEWHETLRPHALGLYLAGRLMRMSKAEVIAFLRDANAKSPESIQTLHQSLAALKGSCAGWAQLAELAETRFLVAGSALAIEPEDAARG